MESVTIRRGVNSITKRWVRGSLFFTLAVLLVAEVVFLYYVINDYYAGTGTAIASWFNTINGTLSVAASAPAEERAQRLYRTVEQFEDKTRFTLELVDAEGNIVMSSSGVTPARGDDTPPDVAEALAAGTNAGSFVGRTASGERVMAMTMLTPYTAGNIVAMRIVTSLTLVDRAIRNIVIASILFLGVIILASIVSGLYFIRSIVIPLQKVEATAAEIAEGNLDTRIDNKSDDEIGSLCKTINYMAGELANSERMKNEFISSVSHELRTPLTSIKGWAETVGRISSPSDPNFRRGVHIISSETDRLYSMVEELLDFSRMQNGLTLAPELLDLAAEVEDAMLFSKARADEAGLELDYTAPESPVPVMADKNRLRQVLVNILDNAIKYSPKGGAIRTELLLDGSNVYVTVTDAGPGISPEDLANVKVKFYKGQGALRGSGIGLAVAEEIMRAHGGALEIASELGEGTSVTLRFPLFRKEKQTGNGTEGNL